MINGAALRPLKGENGIHQIVEESINEVGYCNVHASLVFSCMLAAVGLIENFGLRLYAS